MRTAGFRLFSLGVCLALPVIGFAASSRITQVTLYPGSATVERVAQVEVGATQLEIHCLPDSFNPQSVRVTADQGIRVGDIRIETVRREHTEKCRGSALETRIRTLEDQRAGVEAEQKANALAAAYLNSLGQPVAGEKGSSTAVPSDARQLGQITAALAQNARTVFTEQHQIARRAEDLDRQLAILRQELERTGGQQGSQVRTITVRLKAQQGGQVRVEYQVPRAGWMPAYQASLDFERRSVALERQAVISQRSGEDWRGVKMRLATGRPNSSPAGAVPDTWELNKVIERYKTYQAERMEVPVAAAAPVTPAPQQLSMDNAQDAGFTVETVQGQFATLFDVPGIVDINSGAEKLTLTLANETIPATVRVRTTPRLDTAAYLVATITTPDGVWPAGEMQLRRDGAFVGTAVWNPAQGEETILSFGRDDLVQVKVNPHKRSARTTGLVGSRVEHETGMTYTVLNQHTTAMNLEVLEASPVSAHDDIKVRTTFSPRPTTQNWQDRRGVIAWEQEIAAGATANFVAEYLISYPEGFRITGLPN